MSDENEVGGVAQSSTARTATRTNERSTIDFPYAPLDTAIEVAEALFNRSGLGVCELDELAAEMGQTISGAFRQKTAAARTFGLVEKDGRSAFRLTDLGKRVVSEETAAAAKVEAFLFVPLYEAIFEKYRGQRLPPAKALEREMQSLGVSSKQTDRARQAFERSAHHANFHGSGDDRLVRPKTAANHSSLQEANDEIASPAQVDPPLGRRGATSGSDSDDGNLPLDPIIRGLINRLPPSGEVWPKEKRKLWLQILENSFDLVYEDDPIKSGD